MKFLKYSFISLLVLMLIGSAGYLLAASGIDSKPGYAKLPKLSLFSADSVVSLNLGPGGVKTARWLVRKIVNASDHELELPEQLALRALEDIQGVQLRIYEVEDNRPMFEQAINDSVGQLRQEDWQMLVRVRENDDHVVVMQSTTDELLLGLIVLVSTPENAVFVNLLGPLDPESIAAIAESIN